MGNLCLDFKKLGIKQRIAYGQGTFVIIQGRLRSINFVRKLKQNKVSSVWLIQNKSCKTFCAVKIIKKVEASRKSLIHLAVNQQLILGSINHSLITNMIEAFQDAKNLYIVLEYMPYGSLRDYINQFGNLTQSQTRFVMICLLIQIDYLHKQHIAHLDIKPQNLLIDREGYFRLCDFNLSMNCKTNQKRDKKLKLTGIGTYGYQAPEIYQNVALIGLQSDLYSIGVLCAELLTGISKRNVENFSVPSLKNNLKERVNISNNCIDFLSKLLEQNPSKRLGSRDNFQEVWKHPWLQVSPGQRLQYTIKQVPSFVHDQYRKNRQLNEKQATATDSKDYDELVDRTLIQDVKFQKQFSQFKTIAYKASKAMA